MQLRGPGEVLGNRQSGLPTFLVADVLKDFNILTIARDDAIKLIDDYDHQKGYQQFISRIQENLKENNEYVD